MSVTESEPRKHQTRSRANPGGMDVTKVLGDELQPFDWIVPCGIDHVRVTSVARETGRSPSLPCFRKRMAYRFAEAFGRRQRIVSAGRLLEREAAPA